MEQISSPASRRPSSCSQMRLHFFQNPANQFFPQLRKMAFQYLRDGLLDNLINRSFLYHGCPDHLAASRVLLGRARLQSCRPEPKIEVLNTLLRQRTPGSRSCAPSKVLIIRPVGQAAAMTEVTCSTRATPDFRSASGYGSRDVTDAVESMRAAQVCQELRFWVALQRCD